MTILAVRHQAHEGLGLLEKIFEEHGVSFQYLNAYENPFPSIDLSKVSALVVLGGSMGVYEVDRFPFLSKEIELLREAIRRKTPTLGICRTLPPPGVSYRRTGVGTPVSSGNDRAHD